MTPICRDPDKLCACVRVRHDALLARCYNRNIQLVTIETIRALDRQEYYLSSGVSRTLNSFHLPQEPYGLSLAFDVCPHEYLVYPNWNPEGEKWRTMIRLATELGLLSGFVLWGWDKSHLHMMECKCDVH